MQLTRLKTVKDKTMKKDNFFTQLDKFTESKVFYTICFVVVFLVLAHLVSDCLIYLDNH